MVIYCRRVPNCPKLQSNCVFQPNKNILGGLSLYNCASTYKWNRMLKLCSLKRSSENQPLTDSTGVVNWNMNLENLIQNCENCCCGSGYVFEAPLQLWCTDDESSGETMETREKNVWTMPSGAKNFLHINCFQMDYGHRSKICAQLKGGSYYAKLP